MAFSRKVPKNSTTCTKFSGLTSNKEAIIHYIFGPMNKVEIALKNKKGTVKGTVK